MKFRALKTFAGIVSAVKGQILELDPETANPLVKAKYLIALPTKEKQPANK